MAQQYLLTTHSKQQQQLKGKRFRSEHLVGSPSCRLSGQQDILNKRNLRFPSCFFRPKCHSLWITAAEWFSFWSWFSLSLDQQDSRILSFIKSSRMVFNFCADFHVSLDQQHLQIRSRIKSSWMIFYFGSDFHVSSGPQIRRFRVPLRAAE